MRTICLPLIILTLTGCAAGQRDAIEALQIVFKPSVFAGERFPIAEFEQPLLARHLLGDYQIHTRCFDTDFKEVEKPTQPGRYGARTQVISSKWHEPFIRYTTLFRQKGEPIVDWEEFQSDFATKLPAELGIDDQVAREQSNFLSDHLADLFGQSFTTSSRTAALLAGLYETKPGAGKIPQRLGPLERDREWWYHLRQRLGETPRYPFLVFLPPDYNADKQKNWPTILFLHGSGEAGRNLELVKMHGPHKSPDARQQFILIYPQCPPNEDWLPIELEALLDQVEREYRIDTDRLYLTGLSLGGYGTWVLAARNPDRFAAIAPIAGAGDPLDAPRLRNFPTWIFHGENDPVVPVSKARQMLSALHAVNAHVNATIYPNTGHDSWTATYQNPQLYHWFLQQSHRPTKSIGNMLESSQ